MGRGGELSLVEPLEEKVPLVPELDVELDVETDVMLERAAPFRAARSQTPVSTRAVQVVSWMHRLSSFVNAGSVRRVSEEPQPSLCE